MAGGELQFPEYGGDVALDCLDGVVLIGRPRDGDAVWGLLVDVCEWSRRFCTVLVVDAS